MATCLTRGHGNIEQVGGDQVQDGQPDTSAGEADLASRRPNRGKPVAAQLPRWLTLFDDRWGLTWRVRHQIAEFDLRRSVRMQLARVHSISFDRPVFIVGAPRSGTTTLFRLLDEHPDVHTLGREGHDCWRRYHHPRRGGWRSDAVGAGEVGARERSFVHRWLYVRLGGEGRIVEKTPENAMRIPYLLDLFPDAHIVWVKRDPIASLRSMLAGWRDPTGTFRSYYVPEPLEIPGQTEPRRWCFGLVEGWRDLRSAPLPAIVAEQWRQHVRGALAGRELVPPGRWHEVFLEDLVEKPVATVGQLLAELELQPASTVLASAEHLPHRRENARRPADREEQGPLDEEVRDLVTTLRTEISASGYTDGGRPVEAAGGG